MDTPNNSFTLLYVTHNSEADARKIGEQLLEEQLIACANYFPIGSAYRWEGNICKEDEWVSLLKTSHRVCPQAMARIEDLHPYDVPCIISTQVKANDAYVQWIKESLSQRPL